MLSEYFKNENNGRLLFKDYCFLFWLNKPHPFNSTSWRQDLCYKERICLRICIWVCIWVCSAFFAPSLCPCVGLTLPGMLFSFLRSCLFLTDQVKCLFFPQSHFYFSGHYENIPSLCFSSVWVSHNILKKFCLCFIYVFSTQVECFWRPF